MRNELENGISVAELKKLLKKVSDVRPDGEPAMVMFESNGFGIDDVGVISSTSEEFSHLPEGNLYISAL